MEVDFIIYGPEILTAIEVKNSLNIRPNDLRGLKAFKTDYPEATCLLLYRGNEKLMKNGILCMPSELFLKNLIPGKTLESVINP